MQPNKRRTNGLGPVEIRAVHPLLLDDSSHPIWYKKLLTGMQPNSRYAVLGKAGDVLLFIAA